MHVIVLGATNKEKGMQLESLVRNELLGQGYRNVNVNVIGPGGNEVDVVGEREMGVFGEKWTVPLMCEAKAYADPVTMPTWQKFLGKLLLERLVGPSTIGILVALNGINGNVRGSYNSLREKDDGVFVFDGSHLIERAELSGSIARRDDVVERVTTEVENFVSVEAAYYRAAFYWIVWWGSGQYSLVDGFGEQLSSTRIEEMRQAAEGSLSGELLAPDAHRKLVEARHESKVAAIDALFHGPFLSEKDEIKLAGLDSETIANLAVEPYVTENEDGSIALMAPSQLSGESVGRLFLSLFEHAVPVRGLAFVAEGLHRPYVERLIETIPERQSGFSLPAESARSLQEIAPIFPSVWISLSKPIAMIVSRRTLSDGPVTRELEANDLNEFWEEISNAVQRDYSDNVLRGFLYDHMNVAEFQQTTNLRIKTKTAVVGNIETSSRTGIRQLETNYAEEVGARYVSIRLLATVGEPWDDQHPDPLPLGEY